MDKINLVGENKTFNVSPNLYINYMYEDYTATGYNIANTLKKATNQMVILIDEIKANDFNLATAMMNVKNNIVFSFVNTDMNRKYLENMPHRDFEVLSIVYKWIENRDKKEFQASMDIDNIVAQEMELTEEELYELAVKNTKRLCPPVVEDMRDVRKKAMLQMGYPEPMIDMVLKDMPEKYYFISNQTNIRGSISMIYEELLYSLASKMNSDLYIVPSSIHEVLAVSVTQASLDNLKRTVSDQNADLPVKEVLSDSVYFYNRDTRKVTIAK